MTVRQPGVPGWTAYAAPFFDFYEWVYQTPLPPAVRQPVESLIVRCLSSADATVADLIDYIVRQHGKVLQVRSPVHQQRLMTDARALFGPHFANPELCGRGQVLGALHAALEQSNPGCTGVPRLCASFGPQPAGGAGGLLYHGGHAPTGYAMQPTYPVPHPAGTPPAGHPGRLPDALAERMAADWTAQDIGRQIYIHDQQHKSIMRMWGG